MAKGQITKGEIMFKFIFKKEKKDIKVDVSADNTKLREAIEEARASAEKAAKEEFLSSLQREVKRSLFNQYGIDKQDYPGLMHGSYDRENRLLKAIILEIIEQTGMLDD